MNFLKKLLFYKSIRLKGQNNRVILVKDGREKTLSKRTKIKGLDVCIEGNNNTVKIEWPCKIDRVSIVMKKNNNAVVHIEKNCVLSNLYISGCNGDSEKMTIGEGTTINSCYAVMSGNDSIEIGKDCMLALNIKIWATDAHTVLDTEGNVQNARGGVKVGSHCWIGEDVVLLKQAQIANNSIVGIRSIVTKKFEKTNVVLAGNPAKVVKTGVNWDRAYPSQYEKEKI